jgi:hypothetical protein
MKFCPRCGSKNISNPLPHDLQKYECKDCGYIGAFIIDDGAIAEEIHKDFLKNQNNIENGE